MRDRESVRTGGHGATHPIAIGSRATALAPFRPRGVPLPRLSRRNLLKSGLAATAAGAAIAALPRRAAATRAAAVPGGRERLLLDTNWRFAFGHASDPAQDFGFGAGNDWEKVGAFLPPSQPRFDASAWRTLDLPHDWAVELPVHSGYAPFRFDITDYLAYGGPNVLVVRADATEREGWFYEGAGIYRHVWLTRTHPLHLAAGSTFVSSEVHGVGGAAPAARGGAAGRAGPGATVTVQTEIANDSDDTLPCHAVATIVGPDGRTVATARSAVTPVAAWERRSVSIRLNVLAPDLWSLESPHLYRLILTVELASVRGPSVNGARSHGPPVTGTPGGEVDREEVLFGIRTIRFDAEQGCFLNGRPVKLQGTCNHQDHAGVGSALPDALQAYRVGRLKAFGCNAYRTSHNPPTNELLDACDRLGMLVLDETRLFASVEEGLSQLERMIRRDRNHPSVIAYALENEEWFVQGNERGARIAATMKRLVRRLDPTRPVTAAMNGGWGSRVTELMDVQGFNYENAGAPDKNMDAIHRAFPGKPMWGTEVASTLCTRGIYANDAAKGYVDAYDHNKPDWGALAEQWWTRYAARPWLAGGFVWTGFDYRGEPTPYAWPCISSHFGILDTCGFPKDNFWYYKAWWGTEPVLHLFPHWNWAGREGRDVEVWCHSNLERVELVLNGASLGAKAVPRNGHVAWAVPYAAGTLEARGFRGARQVLTDTRRTTGAPARIALAPDRPALDANGEDVCVVTVEVRDADGLGVPTAGNVVQFRVTGSGKLIGVGNGDPSCHESDKGDTRSAFNGLCCAIVQAGREAGELRLEASSAGLEGAVLVIPCRAAASRPSVA